MATTNLTQVQTDLSYLLGESSLPTATSTEYTVREEYIQKALERIYRSYNFPMNRAVATVQTSNGSASLPTGIAQDGILDVREVVSGSYNDHVYLQVGYTDSDNYSDGNYAYWLTGYEGSYTINTSEKATSPILTIYYEASVPTINASITTPFPSSMAIALGALKYYRLAEDPYTDVSPYENLFQLEMREVIANYNRNRPQVRGRTKLEKLGTYTGDITTVGAYVSSPSNN